MCVCMHAYIYTYKHMHTHRYCRRNHSVCVYKYKEAPWIVKANTHGVIKKGWQRSNTIYIYCEVEVQIVLNLQPQLGLESQLLSKAVNKRDVI